MRNLSQSRFASVLTMAVGAWVLLSPLFISITGAALTNLMVVGGVIVAAGLVQLFWTSNRMPSWVSGMAAIWLFIAAFAFTVSTAAAWSMALSAVAAFILTTWDGVELGQLQEQQYSQHHHAGV